MWSTRVIFGVVLSMLTVGSAVTSTEGKGAQHFNNESLISFASTSGRFVLVAANRSENPTGSSGYAVVNQFDFVTGQFSQCGATNFDLKVNNGRVTLSFVTEYVYNCSLGEQVTATCEQTPNTATFHTVFNRTTTMLDQHYTTHGENIAFNNLTCSLKVFGTDYTGQGSAESGHEDATP
jgi:hypothetical protein